MNYSYIKLAELNKINWFWQFKPHNVNFKTTEQLSMPYFYKNQLKKSTYPSGENRSWPAQLAVHSQISLPLGGRWWFCWHPSLHAHCYRLQGKHWSQHNWLEKRDRESEVKWQLQTAEVDVSAQSWKTELEGKEDSKETGRRGKSMRNRNKGKTPLQQKGFWQPVPLKIDRWFV